MQAYLLIAPHLEQGTPTERLIDREKSVNEIILCIDNKQIGGIKEKKRNARNELQTCRF